ncbi:DMT family transporter [Luteimonas salinilitoris]|uniref:Guanidinium exporter n=1 Tax=Luteimonas salinilitoris TaxID=3237697 RepID=A0ABV4HSQ1_9GAMM
MNPATASIMLVAAGLADVVWAITMKLSQGYTRPLWSVASLLSLALFVWLLGRALTVLPVSGAYAAWTGIGAAGTVLAGSVLLARTTLPVHCPADRQSRRDRLLESRL